MAERPDNPVEVIDAMTGSETFEEALYLFEDFSAKEVAVAASQRADGEGGSPAGAEWSTAFNIPPEPVPPNSSGFAATYAQYQSRFSSADDEWIEWPLRMAAGEWDINLVVDDSPNSPIMRLTLDDGGGAVDIDQAPYSGSAATADTYDAEGTQRSVHTFTGVTIPTNGTYTFRIAVDGKNASSGGYFLHLEVISLFAVTVD